MKIQINKRTMQICLIVICVTTLFTQPVRNVFIWVLDTKVVHFIVGDVPAFNIIIFLLLPACLVVYWACLIIQKARVTKDRKQKYRYFYILIAVFVPLLILTSINLWDMRQVDIPSKYPEVGKNLDFVDRTKYQVVSIRNLSSTSPKEFAANLLFDWMFWRTFGFQSLAGPRDLLFACRIKNRQDHLVISYTNSNNGIARNIDPNVVYIKDVPIKFDIPPCIKERGFHSSNTDISAAAVLRNNGMALTIHSILLDEVHSVHDIRDWLYECAIDKKQYGINCHLQGWFTRPIPLSPFAGQL